jgi:hypothetical protein
MNWKVALPDWVFNRIILVAYLYPPPIDKFRKYVDYELDMKAASVLNAAVKAYLEKGTAPPAAIATVVLNVADDLAAHRTPTLRTGDYIALQMHVRGEAK